MDRLALAAPNLANSDAAPLALLLLGRRDMTPSRSTALLLTLCLLPACATEIDQVGSQEAALAAQDWSAPTTLANTYYNQHIVSVAFLNGTAYAVVATIPNGVSFTHRQPNGVWTALQPMPGLNTADLRLTAFNGRLYLLTQPVNTATLELSRYEPATATWSGPSQLPFESVKLPGFAAHGNQLYLLGSQPGWSHAMWLTTMDAQGTFQPTQPTSLQGNEAALVSHHGRLHALFRSWPDGYSGEGSGDVLHASFDGSVWTAPATISMGNGTSILRGKPMAASYVADGFDCLHVTAMDENYMANVSTVWWTSACDDAGFAVPVSLFNVANAFASHSLAASASELLVAHAVYGSGSGDIDIAARSYHYPRADGQPCTWASDCASALCTTSYADLDGDGFGSTASSASLCGPLPAGRSLTPRDCCDLDGRVRPGQTQYFSSPGGCGGFDYDCSGAAVQLYPPRATSGCTSLGSCMLRTRSCSGPYWTTANTAPACGVAASWRTCFLETACKGGTASQCGALFSMSQTQACR